MFTRQRDGIDPARFVWLYTTHSLRQTSGYQPHATPLARAFVVALSICTERLEPDDPSFTFPPPYLTQV